MAPSRRELPQRFPAAGEQEAHAKVRRTSKVANPSEDAKKLERRRPVGLARDGGGAAAQTMWSGAMEDGCKLATDRRACGRSVRAPPHVREAGYGGEEKSLGPSWLVRSGHGVASFAAVRGGD